MTKARHYLFLQGPPGPFFAELAAALTSRGQRCSRVNFNGGDRVNWHGPALEFRGNQSQWPARFERLVVSEGVTDLLLYGDCRPLHRIACQMAAALGLRVHVFEEGYIRPDWITCEQDGVNGFSRLPKEPAPYLHEAAQLSPIPGYMPIPSSAWLRACEAFTYYAAVWLMAPGYPGYRSHRPHGIMTEWAGWCAKLLASPIRRLRSRLSQQAIGKQAYFILPLQLDSDFQIRTHSNFTGMTDAIELIIASYAVHAPQDCLLVVKEHPLDNGLRPWRDIVGRIAASHGVSDRVRYLSHGHIDALVKAADGVVTINSTTGTFALSSGVPVAVLGRAVYNLPGVTHQGGLDIFWQAPARPQLEIYDAFCRVLIAHCLHRGGFSSRAGRAHLLPAIVQRLTKTRDDIATPVPGLAKKANL